jgi:hypothetical protein
MRLLVLATTLACITAVFAATADARRPATLAEVTRTEITWGPEDGADYLGALWVSSRGTVLLLLYADTPALERATWASERTPPGSISAYLFNDGIHLVPSAAAFPRGAKPIAATLALVGVKRGWAIAPPYTFLRGRKAKPANLHSFCADLRKEAPDLAPLACP